LGVTGGSYGGFMTNWIITHTNRFKAAVTQRSISNWISKMGTTDIGFYFNQDQIAGGFERPVWDERWFYKYWEHSPLKYINNAQTPLLIIHSLEDYRCWLDQALQMFTALKFRGVPSRMVLFPKENHNLSRQGKPSHRIRRLNEMICWFDRFVKNIECDVEV
jgi:dipeptidyl aminopeptidase/acylaminoacyl peptidase